MADVIMWVECAGFCLHISDPGAPTMMHITMLKAYNMCHDKNKLGWCYIC